MDKEYIRKLFPSNFRSISRWADLIDSVADSFVDIYTEVAKVQSSQDIDQVPIEWAHNLLDLIGYKLFISQYKDLNEEEVRHALHAVPEILRNKGNAWSLLSIIYIYYSLLYESKPSTRVDLFELFTEDYQVFMPWVPAGEKDIYDGGTYYRSPHVAIVFDYLINKILGNGNQTIGAKMLSELWARMKQQRPTHVVLHLALAVFTGLGEITIDSWQKNMLILNQEGTAVSEDIEPILNAHHAYIRYNSAAMSGAFSFTLTPTGVALNLNKFSRVLVTFSASADMASNNTSITGTLNTRFNGALISTIIATMGITGTTHYFGGTLGEEVVQLLGGGDLDEVVFDGNIACTTGDAAITAQLYFMRSVE